MKGESQREGNRHVQIGNKQKAITLFMDDCLLEGNLWKPMRVLGKKEIWRATRSQLSQLYLAYNPLTHNIFTQLDSNHWILHNQWMDAACRPRVVCPFFCHSIQTAALCGRELPVDKRWRSGQSQSSAETRLHSHNRETPGWTVKWSQGVLCNSGDFCRAQNMEVIMGT